jgi:uncharacterized protein (TIGR02001 family)
MRLFMYPARRDRHRQSLVRARRAGVAAHLALLAFGMLGAPAARAQASGSASLTSELSVRGVSLSAGRAAPQLSWAYDGEQGWYAGAVAASQLRLGEHDNAAQLIAYGGYAQRLASGLSWEAGMSSTAFRHASEYDYREAYLGLASDRISGRLYFAPAYYGYGGKVGYAEVNGFHPLRERLKLMLHIGLLHRFQAPPSGARQHADLRLALGYDAGACNVQLAMLGGSSLGPDAARGGKRSPRALALSVSYSF